MSMERESDWLEVGTCFFPLIPRRSLFHSTYERKRWKPTPLTFPLLKCLPSPPPPPNQCWLQPPQGWKKRKRDRLIYKLHSSSTCVVFFPSCLLLLAFPPLESDNGHIIRRGNRQHSIFGMIQTMLMFFFGKLRMSVKTNFKAYFKLVKGKSGGKFPSLYFHCVAFGTNSATCGLPNQCQHKKTSTAPKTRSWKTHHFWRKEKEKEGNSRGKKY